MNRVEEIKGRFTRGYYNSDSDSDIEYLLSKLEKTEKDLGIMCDYILKSNQAVNEPRED